MTKRIKVINLKCPPSSFEIRFVLLSRNCSRRLRVVDWQAEERAQELRYEERDLFLFIERLKLLLDMSQREAGRPSRMDLTRSIEKLFWDLSQNYCNLVFIEALSLPTQSAQLFQGKDKLTLSKLLSCQIAPFRSNEHDSRNAPTTLRQLPRASQSTKTTTNHLVRILNLRRGEQAENEIKS